MEFSKKKVFLATCIAVPALLLCLSFFIFNGYQKVINKAFLKDFVYQETPGANAVANLPAGSEPKVLPKPLENPPAILKGIYVTGWSSGSKSYIEYLHSLFKTTQINAVVVDVKDSSGVVSYDTGVQKAKKYGAYQKKIPDIDALINDFHNKGIYVIGRVVVFQDPILAKARPNLAVYNKLTTQDLSKPVLWGDGSGMHWVDPASQEAWDYNIAIAKDALMHGFDEINFDYIRFPTNGVASAMGFPIWDQKTPRHTIIKSFFQKLRESLPGAKISADLFGQVTTNTDDMVIGQILEDSFIYFDFICPMIYPSHYASGFLGYNLPSEHPYEMVKNAMDTALARENLARSDLAKTKIRPWLQDFTLTIPYTAGAVKKEIQAVEDSTGENYIGFLLWNPRNVYTRDAGYELEPALEAIIKEDILPE